jgi:hypothetical protein
MAMKYFFTQTALLAVLLLTQACSSVVRSQQGSEQRHSSPHVHHSEHEVNHDSENSTITQAKLTAPEKILPHQPVALEINIQDPQGKSVTQFEQFQEKLMHVIIVSDDLKIFNHLHPKYKGNGRFEVTFNFPEPNNYTIFSEYKPTGAQEEQVSVMNVRIPGSTPVPSELPKYSNVKILTDTKVNLYFSQPTLFAGKQVNLKFALQEITNKNASNQPVKDLQLYLGEKGHLVIIKSSSPLTASDYIHAHAIQDSPEGQVNFITKFPQPGTYKLWMQFNRQGKVQTADFWVNVE